tara:strand:+ start:1142 stop:1663 length:522 start_codon:yes stop_codon:yes gene_type:complete
MKKLQKLEQKYKELGREIERLKKPKLQLGNDLKVTRYQNDDPIPLAGSNEQWKEFGEKEIGAYCVTKNGDFLYNWYAVNDSRGLAPEGWHILTDKEWDELKEQLLSNSSYAGYRYTNGKYCAMGVYGYFWSSSEYDESDAWRRGLSYCGSDVTCSYNGKGYGFVVRCVRDGIK